MTVKQLINELLNYDMNAVIEMKTSNKDESGRIHVYEFTGIDKLGMCHNAKIDDLYAQQGTLTLALTFHNWELDKPKGE